MTAYQQRFREKILLRFLVCFTVLMWTDPIGVILLIGAYYTDARINEAFIHNTIDELLENDST